MKTYRVGIVGSGFGANAHLPAFNAHDRFEPVALASPRSAQRIAAERKVPHAFPSLAAMLAGTELDVVSIAAPPFTHHDDVLAALAAGKHVIVEKPFALNVAEAEAMARAAERAGVATAVMHEFRWVPERIALHELIRNGHLGALREIEMTHLTSFLRAEGTRPNSWWFEKSKGGGIAGALGSHAIDAVSHLAGRPPKRVEGFVRTANPQRHDANGPFTSTVDDGMFAVLDYGDGLIARIAVDGTVAVDSFTLAVHGEDRTAVASGTGLADMRLFAVSAEETDELQTKPSPHAKFEAINGNVPLIMDLLDEFVKQIETGDGAVPTFAEALETQRVLNAVGF